MDVDAVKESIKNIVKFAMNPPIGYRNIVKHGIVIHSTNVLGDSILKIPLYIHPIKFCLTLLYDEEFQIDVFSTRDSEVFKGLYEELGSKRAVLLRMLLGNICNEVAEFGITIGSVIDSIIYIDVSNSVVDHISSTFACSYDGYKRIVIKYIYTRSKQHNTPTTIKLIIIDKKETKHKKEYKIYDNGAFNIDPVIKCGDCCIASIILLDKVLNKLIPEIIKYSLMTMTSCI